MASSVNGFPKFKLKSILPLFPKYNKNHINQQRWVSFLTAVGELVQAACTSSVCLFLFKYDCMSFKAQGITCSALGAASLQELVQGLAQNNCMFSCVLFLAFRVLCQRRVDVFSLSVLRCPLPSDPKSHQHLFMTGASLHVNAQNE